MKRWSWTLVVCWAGSLVAAAAEPSSIRLPVVRDTWFSAVGSEADCNLGGASRLKLKSIQEMSLVDLDPTPLKGRVVLQAALHVRLSGEEILKRVTVGTFASPWIEGTAESYQPQPGSSTFRRQRHPDVPWAEPGSDLTAVVLGRGGSLWASADASAPDAQKWQIVPIDPKIVAARIAGVSEGFFLFDDTGTEWTRNGEEFTMRLFPNRFFYSRQSRRDSAPYFTIVLGPRDGEPPGAPQNLAGAAGCLPAGEADIAWITPEDRGPAGTVGFFVEIDGKPVPRYLIPAATSPGGKVVMRLRDLGLKPGAEVCVAVRAVDGAGNVGPASKATVRVSEKRPPALPGETPRIPPTGGPLPALGNARVAILDALDKIHPVTRELIPKRPPQYVAANHLWNAQEKRVRLYAAKNEFVEFQVAIAGEVRGLRPELVFAGNAAKPLVSWGRYGCVASQAGPLPDPVLPLDRPVDVPDPRGLIGAQRVASLHCEVYVPHEIEAGVHHGALRLRSQESSLDLDVTLEVWDFTLPDFLSFLPEMNCYGLPAAEREYYRLAHRHRTVLNRVPYSQRGDVADGCAPRWDGRRLDWTEWDRRFGPYFDGSAFADLPRRCVPIECFYLPLHENWPAKIEPAYNGSYWADQAFAPSYREAFVEAARQIAEHCAERGWRDTMFLGFLNNKIDFKRRGWSRGSSPWLLDEPANLQDFWALRYFGEAFHEGIAKARSSDPPPRLLYRCDISRPQWQRDVLDHVLNYNVVNAGSLRSHPRLVIDRKERFGQVVLDYGSTNAIEQSNMQPVGWCIDSWCLGSDGVIPWQTIGSRESWKQADPLSLFYPGPAPSDPQAGSGRSSDGSRSESEALSDAPIPSIRLKAYRRGQQDVEYLVLLAELLKEPRWAVGQSVRQWLGLEGQRRGTGVAQGEDAGMMEYASLLPETVWSLRVRVGRALSAMHPPTKRKRIDFPIPSRPAARPAASASQ